jgi:4-carboxymuconolactone decarboxylase
MSDTPVITIEDVRAVAPALAAYTEDAIVNGLWKRTELSARDRSIITVSAMVARERAIGFRHYFSVALNTGVTPSELSEIITHIAFYAGWSTAFSAVAVLKDIFAEKGISIDELPLSHLTPDRRRGTFRRERWSRRAPPFRIWVCGSRPR